MESNVTKFKDELEALIKEGQLLLYSLALEFNRLDEETAKKLRKVKLPDFRSNYERWYSASMQVVKRVLPDRLSDFVKQYRDEKRKEVDVLTYGVADHMIGLKTTRGMETVVDGSAAVLKFQQQLNILRSAEARFEGSLFDMTEILQAELFDSELDAATELAQKGFLRGAGAVAGVVLERHLAHVCWAHNLKTRKKAPTINDFNQMLKDGDVIETPMWRSIQHLGDLRNLCDHSKGREPSRDEMNDLVSGVTKVIKTLF